MSAPGSLTVSDSSNALDSSGLGNHGKVWGASLTEDRNGNPESAYHFGGAMPLDSINGMGDYIDCGENTSLAPISNTLTVSIWIKPETLSTIWGHRRIVGRYQNTKNGGWFISIGDDHRLMFAVGAPKSRAIIKNDTILELDKYYHVVAIYDKYKSMAKIYVNGKLNESHSPEWGKMVLQYTASTDTDLRMSIGRFEMDGYSFFRGDIDEVYIYNRVLSENEVFLLYSL